MSKIIGSGGGGKGGGGGNKTPTEAKDNLDSKSFARVLDLIGEGEIGGLVDGAKSIFLNNTPLQAADGSFNFSGIQNTSRAGVAVPLIYGTTLTGSTVISAEIENEQVEV